MEKSVTVNQLNFACDLIFKFHDFGKFDKTPKLPIAKILFSQNKVIYSDTNNKYQL